MNGLGSQSVKVPHHVRILQMGLRVSFLRVYKAGEENRVSDEENGGIVAHQIPNTVLGVEFHRKTSRITCSVS